MLDKLKMEKDKVKVFKHGQMELTILENGLMIWLMEKVYFINTIMHNTLATF